ncbi:amidohydrolase family protein [Sedimentitalea todarodis]|uniref:Amidohydrolase family protein n=1 Tax=Sedimentitalea todarodis TaxID=1631240 RepID=A0ABU3VHE3_9RHOB|nr:amidohydrolase family protein [Sedimentitalea todarodis]MDU9005611.1 amidohydrolase family protein [Sedimentitalea todarodis]
MVIDTHQHFWKLDRGDYGWLTPELEALYRDFLPQDLKPLLDAAGIHGTIAVQAADTEAETKFLLSLADEYDWIHGVVGWVDLEAKTAPDSIARLAAHPKLVGLRPMIQDIPDDRWMLRDTLGRGIAAMVDHNLTFDALVMPRHLKHLLVFLAKYPDLRVVVDHCAKPEIRNNAFDVWARDLKDIAQDERVFCKVSGLVTEAAQNWSEADLKPFIGHVLEVFPERRLLFGSDWPVLNLASDYQTWKDIAVQSHQAKGRRGIPDYAAEAYPRISTRG